MGPVMLRRALVAAASIVLVVVIVFAVGEGLADPAALRLGRGASPEAIAATTSRSRGSS